MNEMVARIAALQDYERYEDLHWEGSFEDYLQIVQERPQVTRNAFQRVYDMIVSYGEEEYIDNKKRLDALPVLHGPDRQRQGRDLRPRHPADAARARAAGRRRRATAPRSASSCCTARSARRRARSRACSRRASSTTRARPRARSTRSTGSTSQGTGCVADDDEHGEFPCPMHEEPLRLIPHEWRDKRDAATCASATTRTACKIEGDLDPACRFIFQRLLQKLRRRLGQGRRQPRARASACC